MLAARASKAQELGFGSKGQVVLDSTGTSLAGQVGINPVVLTPFIAFATTSTPLRTEDNGTRTVDVTRRETTFILNPGIDVFVIDHLSLGGEILIGKSSVSNKTVTRDKRTGIETTVTSDAPSPTFFGILPRIGYDIPLGRHFSFWPRGGFGYLHTGYSEPAPAGPGTIDTSESFWLVFVDAIFNWHPTQSFFIGAGPGFTTTVSHSVSSGGVSLSQPSATTFRFLAFTIGGVID